MSLVLPAPVNPDDGEILSVGGPTDQVEPAQQQLKSDTYKKNLIYPPPEIRSTCYLPSNQAPQVCSGSGAKLTVLLFINASSFPSPLLLRPCAPPTISSDRQDSRSPSQIRQPPPARIQNQRGPESRPKVLLPKLLRPIPHLLPLYAGEARGGPRRRCSCRSGWGDWTWEARWGE